MAIPTEDFFDALDGTRASFNVLTPSRKRARKAAYSVMHTAFGNENIVTLGGRLEATRDYQCYVANDGELENIDQALGQQGTLHCAEGDVIAALVGYDASAYWNTSEQLVTLSFVTNAD